ncbi:hypothetical protein GNI_026250, partial [Gregarina niphandrodes]
MREAMWLSAVLGTLVGGYEVITVQPSLEFGQVLDCEDPYSILRRQLNLSERLNVGESIRSVLLRKALHK